MRVRVAVHLCATRRIVGAGHLEEQCQNLQTPSWTHYLCGWTLAEVLKSFLCPLEKNHRDGSGLFVRGLQAGTLKSWS